MVTRLSIPIQDRGKSPEEGQRWKKKQHKNYQDEDKKSAINKKSNSLCISKLLLLIRDSNLKLYHFLTWFGLVSLFNDISTFMGYLMLKPFL